MKFKEGNAKKLTRSHLEMAAQRLISAEALFNIGNYADAVSRVYYATLDAATACLIKKDVLPHSHAGAIKLFSLHHIKPGIVDRKHQRQFARIEKARIEADHTHLRTFTKEETSEILAQAHEFVEMAKRLSE